MSKKSRNDLLYTESRYGWECGYKGCFEWSCEGSLKFYRRVGAYGNPVRYQWGAYDGMQNERMYSYIKLGGTAEV